MTRRKFEEGARVQATRENAPAKFKGRTGIVRDKQRYAGYGVEFDDTPGTIERVSSNWLELVPLDVVSLRELVSPQQIQERRHSDRVPVDCFVAIEFEGRRILGECVDYGRRGFGAIVEHKLPLGWNMIIELPLTGRKPLRVQARPVYKKNFRYGFEFVPPDKNKRALIAEFFEEFREGE